MKKLVIFILVLMFTVSWSFAGTAAQFQTEKAAPIEAQKAAPIQYDPSNYPAPERQGGETIADATVIGSLPYNDFGSTVGYVDDYDEVCPYTGSTSPDVVYSFTPAGDVTNGFVSLCGDTDYDSKLYIYENAVTPGTPFACNDDECVSALGQNYVSELTGLTFTGGNTYYFVVDGYGGNSGNYEIDVTGEGGGTTFDPPTDVAVDEATGTVSWSAPVIPNDWLDDMDSYNAGEYLALQSDDWTTWSGTPGGADDGYVVDELSFSGSNSVKVEGAATDLIHEFGMYTTGVYEVSMMMYIEPGHGGYYNLLHFFNGTSSEWGMEVYFGSTGIGDLCATAQNITTFSHPVGSWFEVMCIIDLDADWAEYYVDGTFVYEWQWSIDTLGNQGSCEFGATDIFAMAATGDTAMFYCDDVMLSEVFTRDLTGYNVYIEGVLAGSVGVDVFEFTYAELVAGDLYTAGVSALYDGGESDIVEVPFTYIPIFNPPINLAVVSNPADDFATFTWGAPGRDNTRDLLGYDVHLDGEVVGTTTEITWVFNDLVNGVFYDAGLVAVYDEGNSDLVEINFEYAGTSTNDIIVVKTQLNNNYPNPFNPVTNIAYSIKTAGNVTLEVYNIKGQLVKTLINEVRETGNYTTTWNGTDDAGKSLASGVYFYKMKASNYTATKKMILMK